MKSRKEVQHLLEEKQRRLNNYMRYNSFGLCQFMLSGMRTLLKNQVQETKS
jgi:hypothetical protein